MAILEKFLKVEQLFQFLRKKPLTGSRRILHSYTSFPATRQLMPNPLKIFQKKEVFKDQPNLSEADIMNIFTK